MKSLDTNILIRFLVDDDRNQGEKVRSLFEKAEKTGSTYLVTTPVLLEILYVLDSVYKYSKEEIINALDMLCSLSFLIFENIDAVQSFLSAGKKTKIELEDLLIGSISRGLGCEKTITFDRKAAKSELFELLK